MICKLHVPLGHSRSKGIISRKLLMIFVWLERSLWCQKLGVSDPILKLAICKIAKGTSSIKSHCLSYQRLPLFRLWMLQKNKAKKKALQSYISATCGGADTKLMAIILNLLTKSIVQNFVLDWFMVSNV